MEFRDAVRPIVKDDRLFRDSGAAAKRAVKELAEKRVTGGFYLRAPNPFERAAAVKPVTRGDVVRRDLEECRGERVREPAQQSSVDSPIYGAAPGYITRADDYVVRTQQLQHRR